MRALSERLPNARKARRITQSLLNERRRSLSEGGVRVRPSPSVRFAHEIIRRRVPRALVLAVEVPLSAHAPACRTATGGVRKLSAEVERRASTK